MSCNPRMGLPFPLVENLTAELRAIFPRPFLLYMNDCVDRWPHIPPALDLVGMDRYTVSRNGMDEVRGAKAYFTASVFPKLREHQRAMLVPGLVGCSPNSSFGRKVTKAEQEVALLEKLEGYYAWAVGEPRIAGLNSWHFNHCKPQRYC